MAVLLLPVVLLRAPEDPRPYFAAGGVVTERIKPNGGITRAGCQAKKRKITPGGI